MNKFISWRKVNDFMDTTGNEFSGIIAKRQLEDGRIFAVIIPTTMDLLGEEDSILENLARKAIEEMTEEEIQS